MKYLVIGMKKNAYLLLLLLLSTSPLFDLLHPGLPVTHDGQDHVARIAAFYQNLQEGNIIPRWAGNLNWGYGHPVLMFLYPLPSYIASFFHLLGFSLVDSIKLVFGIAFTVSGASMYFWARNVFGERGGFLTSILYLFAPYRFVDLYVRGALGEHVAFIFPPLILYFFLKLTKQYSYWYVFGGALSVAGLILSHNAITIMFLPFIIAYSLYLIWQSNKRGSLIAWYLSIIVFGFGLSSFFLFPAYFEGKYTLRDIVTAKEYATRFVEPIKFTYSGWSYGRTGELNTEIGIVQTAGVLLSLLWFTKFSNKDKKLKSFWGIVFFTFLSSLFIMTVFSKPLWDFTKILQKFQFPWRFLAVTVFTSSILSAFALKFFPKRIEGYGIVLTILAVFFLTQGQWYAKSYSSKPETFYTGVYAGTTDTGESAPIWSVRFMEKEPDVPIEVINGHAQIIIVKRNVTNHMYEVNSSGKSRIQENTLYFPGWDVYLDNKKLDVTREVEYQDQAHRGLITFFVPDGEHTVKIIFSETKLRRISTTISLVSVIGLISYGVLSYAYRFKKKYA